MIRSVLFLRPVLGDPSSVEQFFDDEQVLQRAARTPGFVSAELHRSTDGSDLMLVTALWESEGAYQTWVDDPWRAANADRAGAVFEAIEVDGGGGSRYQTVIAVTAPVGGGAEAPPCPDHARRAL
jgi:heme-degrading monooxygenase HmoA